MRGSILRNGNHEICATLLPHLATKDLQLLHDASALHVQSLQAPLVVRGLFEVLYYTFLANETALFTFKSDDFRSWTRFLRTCQPFFSESRGFVTKTLVYERVKFSSYGFLQTIGYWGPGLGGSNLWGHSM